MFLNEKGECIKVVYSDYDRLYKIRGNTPSIYYAYEKLLEENDTFKIETFMRLYPEFSPIMYEFILYNSIVKNIIKNYINRFINKKVTFAPPETTEILESLFRLYVQDPINNRLSPEFVTKYIKEKLSIEQRVNLYNQYKNRERLYGDGFKISEELKQKIYKSYYKKVLDVKRV